MHVEGIQVKEKYVFYPRTIGKLYYIGLGFVRERSGRDVTCRKSNYSWSILLICYVSLDCNNKLDLYFILATFLLLCIDVTQFPLVDFFNISF